MMSWLFAAKSFVFGSTPLNSERVGLSQRLLDLFTYGFHLLLALVLLPRPEEAPQPVLLAAGHHMNMQMGHALTDAVVDRYECALRPDRRLERQAKARGM